MKISRKIKIPIIVAAIIVLLLMLYYAIFFYPTNDLFSEAKSVLAGEKVVDESNPLWRYNFRKKYYPDTETIESSIGRIWVWHNGKKGVMQVLYSVRYYDKNGKIDYCSIGIPSKWYIEKENGKWKVTKIDEHP